MGQQHGMDGGDDGAEPDFDRYAGSLAEIMERALDAFGAEHDQLDLTHGERHADEQVLRGVDEMTWPTRHDPEQPHG
ncbi:hypothetical protein ACFVHB_39930 [Kitasatospora sp. NPDC127111]|uniref:hypothetical protein n=1 Tax=Kitasatospora sp. NPDC127111 TaxID=3345363 RepID=UPI0036284DBF